MTTDASTTHPGTTARPAAQLRVSDAEREAVAGRLRAAATEGRLTLAEADERQAAAYAARTRDELAVLTTDLPAPPVPVAVARRGRGGVITVAARRRLAVHAAIVAVIAVAMLTRWALGPIWWFWPAVPMFWLTISLVVHHRWAAREPAPAVVTTT